MTDYATLVERIWRLNRVHVSDEMEAAFQQVHEFYAGSELIRYKSGRRCGALGSWKIPDKWIVHRGQLRRVRDNKLICDFAEHPLRLFAYSPSFCGVISRDELLKHVLTNPKLSGEIPFHFRNQYRAHMREWGFCLRHDELRALTDGEYAVDIETEFLPAEMTQLEYVKTGQTPRRFLLLSHFDHPAMCNDGLLGCIAANEIVRRLHGRDTYYSYASLNTVEIVGTVAYCEFEPSRIEQTTEALFLAGPGIDTSLAYQTSSRPETCAIDRAMTHIFSIRHPDSVIAPFRRLWGNDEIALEVPGIDVRCGLLARQPFPAYHTSADNFESINFAAVEETITLVLDAIELLENNFFVETASNGLPCYSAPEIDLYLSPAMMSQVSQSLSLKHDLLAGMTDADCRYVERNPDRLNHLMTAIAPRLADRRSRPDVLGFAEASKLPFRLVLNYFRALETKKLVRLVR